MHQVLPYSENYFDGVTKANILSKIWCKPQATLAFILAKCPDEYISILFFLGGIARAMSRAISQSENNSASAAGTLLLAIVMGSISGWITSSMYTWGLCIVGRWLGGLAGNEKFRVVVAWSQVPSIAALALLLPAVAFLKDDSFQSIRLAHPALKQALLLIVGIGQVLLSTWSVAILLRGVRLIQGFNGRRALVNILLPGGLVIALILLASLLLKF